MKRKVLTALREAGLIAWLRTPAQGFDEHIHFVELASKTLAPSAARQVTAYLAGRNGLKDNNPDDGPVVEIPTALPADVQEDDMSQYEDQLNELLALAKRTDARVLTTQGAVEKIHGLVRDVAKAIPNMSRRLGYLMEGVEGQGASPTALAAQVDAALASTSAPALVAQPEQIRTELDDVIKAAS